MSNLVSVYVNSKAIAFDAGNRFTTIYIKTQEGWKEHTDHHSAGWQVGSPTTASHGMFINQNTGTWRGGTWYQIPEKLGQVANTLDEYCNSVFDYIKQNHKISL